jgi:DNA repair protein RecO (recombination protein O)
MPLKATQGFVLRAHAVGEADQILVFLTRDEGKLRGLAHSSRKSRRRFAGALQPLSHVRIAYFEREGRELSRIDQCDLLHSYFRLQQDLRASGYLSYMAEVAEEFSRERQEEERFYRLLHATLAAIEGGLDPGWGARYFELWTLRLHGLLPDLEECAECGSRLLAAARYTSSERQLRCVACSRDRAGVEVPAAALTHLRALLHRPPAEAEGEEQLQAACGDLLQQLLTGFTERPFRSLGVLDAMGVR